VQPSCYAYLTHKLTELTDNGKIIVALEGGYNLESISEASEYTLRSLLGENPIKKGEDLKVTFQNMIKTAVPTRINFERIKETRDLWQKHWSCLEKNNWSKSIVELYQKVERETQVRQKIVGPEKLGNIEFIAGKNDSDFTVLKCCSIEELKFYQHMQDSKDFNG